MLTMSSILGLAAVSLLAFGCGKSENGTAPPAAAVHASAPSPQEAKEVVSHFLDALFRKGDSDAASKLLTKLARQKVAETHHDLALPPNESMKFEVGDPYFPTDDRTVIHVPSRSIFSDELGGSRTESDTWVCRLEDEGWRVAAFAAFVYEGEKPYRLSFENPEEMAREQQRMVDDDKARQSRHEAATPTSPENSSQAGNPQDPFRR